MASIVVDIIKRAECGFFRNTTRFNRLKVQTGRFNGTWFFSDKLFVDIGNNSPIDERNNVLNLS